MKKRCFYKTKFFDLFLGVFLFVVSCTSKNTTITESDKSVITLQDYTSAVVYVTSKNTQDRITNSGQLKFSELPVPDENFPTIVIDPEKTFQTIIGFGGALTDASAETFYKLNKERQDKILKDYFDPNTGIGYTLCRTNINSCDFSSDSYTYAKIENDTALSQFTIEHDKKYRIPLIKEALKVSNNQLRFFASPWSPPAWMKTNNDMLHGGKLKPEYYQTWANYYIRFMQEYQKEGISFWGLSVQNEPAATQAWESCVYTAEEERDFVKNFLGPTLQNSGFASTKLVIWDHNRGIMYPRAKVVYDDPEASKYVWGTGIHWYVGNHYENVKLLNEAFPDKKLLFTEGCFGPFKFEDINNWKYGELYATSIINDLNNSVTGWMDWNILLDETGGPNHVSNFCFAPVIADTKTGKLYYMNSFFYLGHFSKFIRPGAKRVICSLNTDNLLATAFLNTDKSIAIVVLNSTSADENYKVWLKGRVMETKISANSIVTLVLK
jgi:glucosylceramidase